MADEGPAGRGLARPASAAVRRSEALRLEGTSGFAWPHGPGRVAEAGETGRSNEAQRSATRRSLTQPGGHEALQRRP